MYIHHLGGLEKVYCIFCHLQQKQLCRKNHSASNKLVECQTPSEEFKYDSFDSQLTRYLTVPHSPVYNMSMPHIHLPHTVSMPLLVKNFCKLHLLIYNFC